MLYSLKIFHARFFCLISLIISLLIHLGSVSFFTVDFGTYFSVAVFIFSLSIVHASSDDLFSISVSQSMLARYDLIPGKSAFVQFVAFLGALFFTFCVVISVISMQWSLLPSFPSSYTDIMLLAIFVINRSRMLPLSWVGKRMSWARSSCSTALYSSLPWASAAPPPDQSIRGRFISPITTVFR